MDSTAVALVVVFVLAVAAAVFVVARLRRARAEPYYHFRCPGCRRRLRYHARQAGNAGGCNNCGSQVTFPPISQSVD